jgi:hypothetical protein
MYSTLKCIHDHIVRQDRLYEKSVQYTEFRIEDLNTLLHLQVRHLRCVLCKMADSVGLSKHNSRSIVFNGLTMTCFGRAWPSSGHKLFLK